MNARTDRLTLSELKAVCSKGSAEPFWISRYLIRPWSVYVTYVAMRLGLSPSQVTVISALLAVGSGMLALWPSRSTYLGAAVGTLAFFVLDHVDGELARARATLDPPSREVHDIAGKYLDRLVHYLQAPSLVLGISVGIAIEEANAWWGILGILCAIGSGGFPRFTAAYDLLVVSLASRTDANEDFVRGAIGFDVAHGGGLLGRRFFLIPRSKQDVMTLARQYVGFPGSLFVISLALVVDVARMPAHGPTAVKWVLGLYALVLSVNLVHSARRYFVLLSRVPK